MHGAPPEMHQRAHRLHHRTRNQVRGNGGERQYVEEEDEHWRHERAAAHAGEPDDDANSKRRDREREVEAHVWQPAYGESAPMDA